MTDRLPPETRIGMVTLQVADMSRSLAFYQGLLGMTLISRLDERAWLGGGDSIRPLLELREKNGVAPVPSRGRLGLYHFALLLPERGDLARFLAHLTESGIRTAMADHLVSEALYLSDPDGLGVEVYVDRPRGAWRLSNGEYEMATELLDIPDLMSSLAGGVWQGMPSGDMNLSFSTEKGVPQHWQEGSAGRSRTSGARPTTEAAERTWLRTVCSVSWATTAALLYIHGGGMQAHDGREHRAAAAGLAQERAG